MAALWNRAGHYIFILWFLSIYLFFFFLRLISAAAQPNFAALNRGRHLYSAGRPSRWALAHISSYGRPGHYIFALYMASYGRPVE